MRSYTINLRQIVVKSPPYLITAIATLMLIASVFSLVMLIFSVTIVAFVIYQSGSIASLIVFAVPAAAGVGATFYGFLKLLYGE